MTLVQEHPRSAGIGLVRRISIDAVDTAGPHVWDDMSVEVALAAMSAARTGRLVICDQDGRHVGEVTRTELAAVRDSAAYTDRVRLRDLHVGRARTTDAPSP